MSIDEKALSEERDYLDTVMSVLCRLLDKRKQALEKSKQEVIELNKTMMDDIGNDVQSLGKFVDAYSYLVEIDSRAGVMHDSEVEYARLLTMQNSPYFARMDFKLKDSAPMKIYIGINSLIDEESLDFYVFDWRSPIAGMYYDYELGEAKYEAPRGEVEGEVTLKRQFKIWKGELLSAYDSSIAIEDDVLSEALSKSADSKMRDIVCTIQREQNQIIRDKESKVLVAFGPAGSGKTSVAMQRAAFFLYAYRDTVTSGNLMIFSPNNVFGDYISEVLPRLGEENIKSTPFNEYVSELFEGKYKFLPASEFLDFSVYGEGIRKKAAMIKTSARLADALSEHIKRLSGKSPAFPDMIYGGKCLMKGIEMDRLYTKDFSYLSIQARLNKLFARVSVFAKEEYKKIKKKALETFGEAYDESDAKEKLTELKWKIREEYRSFLSYAENVLSADPEKIYLEVLHKIDRDVYDYTKELLSDGIVQSEDAAPLAYILSATREIKNEVKYLIVDEAQDYTRLHFEAMKNCFRKANITFLGDTNQSVCPMSPLVTGENIASVFPESSVKYLTKSYRSTAEISAFCGKILNLSDVDYMKRSGEAVSMTSLHSKEDYLKSLVNQSLIWKREGRTSAIIFPTARECQSLYDKYGKSMGLTLVTDSDKKFKTGNVIIPSYMAKGLEFDAVAIPYNSFSGEELKHLYYTACTRALHVLKLFKY